MDRSAVILAGGCGRRMGGLNKALLTIGTDMFIDRQIRVCSEWTDDVIVVSNDEEFARELGNRHLVTVAGDRYPGDGPLAGLHAGLMAAAHPHVWLLACDQPLASVPAAFLLLDRLKRDGAMAALPVLDGKPQPLHAVYRKEIADTAEDLLRQGDLRLMGLLDLIPWSGVIGETFEASGIPADFAKDVDTPEDYIRIQNEKGAWLR